MKQIKKFTTLDIINILSWYNDTRQNVETSKKFDFLPIKIQWGLKRNIDILSPIVKSFEDFRKELSEKIKTEFFNEEKSEIVTITNDKGQDEEFHQVKEKYLNEYKEVCEELNQKLAEILYEVNEVAILTFDLDEVLGESDETGLTMDDIVMLSFMEENS